MSWWAQMPDDYEAAEPFTVVLSVGAPEPARGRSEPRGPDHGQSGHDDGTRHWMWQEAVTALLQAVFVRGGTVTSRFDDELFPFLWATARIYAESVPAEHGDRRPDAPLELIAIDGPWYEGTRDDSEAIDSVSAFEATGAVKVRRERQRDAGDFWTPGPGRHFGVVLWPDLSTEADVRLMDQVERLVVVRWPQDRLTEGWASRQVEEVALEDDTPPFRYLFENRLDEWLRPPPPADATADLPLPR